MTENSQIPVVLVDLTTPDGKSIDALLYESPQADRGTAVVHIHGKGTSFLGGPGRFIPPRWPNVLHISLNMRFRDLAFTRADIQGGDFTEGKVPVGGGFWERTAQGKLDIQAAVDFLRGRNVKKIIIAGHSSGGLYTALYGAHDPSIFARVLISPLTGSRTVFPVWFPDPRDLDAAQKEARRLVEIGKPDELISLSRWYYAISAQSFVDRLDEPENLWADSMGRCDSPVLMLWGQKESRDALWRSLFDALPTPTKAMQVIPDAGHYFVGFEDQVASHMRDFVDSLG